MCRSGLPAAAREVVNSVFLYYCTKAGLDLAIVNAEKLERYASIPEDERRMAEDLLFKRADAADHRARRCARPTGGTAASRNRHQSVSHRGHRGAFPRAEDAKRSPTDLPLDQRLANYIIEGSKDGLIADLDRKRGEGAAPLESSTGRSWRG